MDAFVRHEGLVVPLDRHNVDTDVIIPKQFLTSIQRTGFGPNLFDSWRYLDKGEPGQAVEGRPKNPDFVLNDPRFAGATILLARDNFGCGSSREHAVWALVEHGFKAMIAPSFGDILHENSLKNGLLPIVLAGADVDRLFDAARDGRLRLAIDLEAQTVRDADGRFDLGFAIDPFRKACMLEGLDEIALTLKKVDAIRDFEQKHLAAHPWLAAPV